MATTTPLESIAEFSDELKHYYAFGIDTATAMEKVLNFIYTHRDQDGILDFLFTVYTQLVIYGVDDTNLLRRLTREFFTSPSLDQQAFKDYVVDNLTDDNKNTDKLVTTIKLLRYYLPQLDTIILQIKNLK